MRARTLWLAPLIAALLGCPSADDDDSAPSAEDWPLWSLADRVEEEPNDEVPEELGTLELDYALAGTSSRCSSNGTWVGADEDRFAFRFQDDVLLRLRLRAQGADLDMELFTPDGAVLVEAASEGVDDEEMNVALSGGVPYSVRIRCWLGGDPGWILAFLDRDAG